MDDQATILRIAEQVRREHLDVGGHAPPWSVGTCQFISSLLAQRLIAAGLKAVRVGGYYTTARNAGPADGTATRWDGAWMHWWVECEGFVVDVAADQGHPANPSAAGVVVVPKDSASAYREWLPVPERHGGVGRVFEQ